MQPLQAGSRVLSALPSAQVRDAPQLEAAEVEASGSDELRAAGRPSGHAAAEPRQAAARTASVPDELQAVPEAAASGHAAAEPGPEAALQAASERQAAGAVAEQPDGPRVEAAAEALQDEAVRQPAVVRPAGEAVRQPAAARRADEAAPQQAAVQPGARVPRAVQPLAVPSAAASVFRQGPSLGSGPARPRVAKRFAHAMRSLPIASRSEPWSQAARNEGWSCGEIPRKVL
ncbi:hypothetical protein ACVWY3_006360 [Bradyrhizobium sp. USDA 4486]